MQDCSNPSALVKELLQFYLNHRNKEVWIQRKYNYILYNIKHEFMDYGHGMYTNKNEQFEVQVIHGHSLQWRHNGRNVISNHQPHHCLLNRLFRRRSKETSKLHVTGLCAGNSPVTGEFPARMARNAENVSIWWRHHVFISIYQLLSPLLALTHWGRVTHYGDGSMLCKNPIFFTMKEFPQI